MQVKLLNVVGANLGVTLGSLTILFLWGASFFPGVVEYGYSRGIFLGIRVVLDTLLNRLPFAGMYIFLAFCLLGVGRRTYIQIRAIRARRFSIVHWLQATMNTIGWVVCLFFLLWGFNYYRIPVEKQLGLELSPLNGAMLRREMEAQTAALIDARNALAWVKGRAMDSRDLPENLEAALRNSLESVLQDAGYPGIGNVRGRFLYPGGVFLRFSTAGLYFPFTGEGHIDAGLHPVQWPFTMAHELAHGYGFGHEGVCNFWAVLATLNADDPAIRYSGRLGYWRYVAVEYRRYDPEGFKSIRDRLPDEINLDLDAMQKAMNRFPDLIPRLQYRIYDTYLKSQGIKAGMLSYNEVLLLVHTYAQKHGKL